MVYLPPVVIVNPGSSVTESLSPETRELLTARLAAAEEAQHLMSIGQQARVFVDQNGERVEFNLISATNLRAYVMQLRAQLGLPSGMSGPLRPWVL